MTHRIAPLLALAALGACDGCQRSALVPFKADAGTGVPEGDPPEGAAPPAAEAAFSPVDGESLPPGTRRVAVEGAPLAAPEGETLRGLLPVDVTGDGARDAIVALAGPAGDVRLGFAARRTSGGFGALSLLGPMVPGDPTCTVDAVALKAWTPRIGSVVVARRCGPEDDGHREHALALLTLDRRPRLAARLWARPPEATARPLLPTPASPVGGLALTPKLPDDGEGADVLVDVGPAASVHPGLPRVTLPFRLGPSGLTRVPGEPEATLAQAADDALETLRDRGPEASKRPASRALQLHQLVCREGGAPWLRVGAADAPAGLSCGPSPAAAQALAVRAAAEARLGRLGDALASRALLDHPAFAPSPQDRQLVADALGGAPTLDVALIRTGPPVETTSRPPVHRSRLAFLTEDAVLVRGERPLVLDFRTGRAMTSPPPIPPRAVGDAVTNLGGDLAAARITQDCAGHRLELFAAGEIVAGVIAGRPRASAPLTEEGLDDADCSKPEAPRPVAENDGGFVVLGWPPQGVLAARDLAVHLVPLTAGGEPAGAPRILPRGSTLPAPLVPGSVSADGRHRVLAFGESLLVVHLGAGDEPRFLAPPGGDAPHRPRDPAISPSGQRLAWIAGDRIQLWGEVDGTADPAPSAPDTTAGPEPGSPTEAAPED